MPNSCKCILDRMVFKGAMTEEERDKILRNLKTQKPKKFNYEYGANIYGGIKRICPTCADEVVLSARAIEYEVYCRHCGQKIERSVKNE